MASERERAKEEYLVLREQKLKVEKKHGLVKMLADILYMLSGGVIIGALIYMFSVWTQIEGGDRVVRILLFAAGFVIFARDLAILFLITSSSSSSSKS